MALGFLMRTEVLSKGTERTGSRPFMENTHTRKVEDIQPPSQEEDIVA